MDGKTETQTLSDQEIFVDQVNRVLEIGQLLLSVLTPDELDQLRLHLTGRVNKEKSYSFQVDAVQELGNTSVT